MKARFALFLPVLLASATVAAAAGRAETADALPPACGTFALDVSDELAALGLPSTMVVAARDGASGDARIEPGRRYDVRLHPEAEVTLAAVPSRAPTADTVAGLLVFQVPVDGRYRVSLTTAHWIDVVDGGDVVVSTGHEGRRGCPLLRKVVEFDLAAGRDLVLQVLGDAGTGTGVLVTPATGGTR